MSPASYLTAPPRVATGMIAPLLSLVALALLVGLAAVVGSTAFAGMRAIAVWRDFRGFSHALGAELESFADSLERLAAFQPHTERLTTSFARMEASRERLSVLTSALGRVQGQWAGLTAIYPKK
jgi:hypothetical protein